MSDALVDLLERAGATNAVSTGTLDFVLSLLGVQDERARIAAGVAYQDRPVDALALAATSVPVVSHLEETEAQFAESAYEHELTDSLVAREPEPLGQVLGILSATISGTSGVEAPPVTANGRYTLFPHQRRAVLRASRLLALPDSRSLIHMPTGSGKTRSAMNIVGEHLRTIEPTVVVWAASTKELLAQAAWEFSTAWTALGNRRVEVGHGWDGRAREVSEIGDGFVAATLQGLHRFSSSDRQGFARLADRCTLMVFDEAHQAIAPTFADVTEAIADRARLLGLSATPGRTAEGRTEQDRALAAFFENRKVTLDTSPEGSRNPVRYLINNGYLAEPQFRVEEIDRDPRVYAGTSITPGVDPAYVAEVVRLVLKIVEDEQIRRPMLFASSVEEARLIAAASTAMKLPGRYVAGDMPKSVREDAVEWFKRSHDEPRLLTNFNVLSTGFDSPMIDATVIARPTESLVLYSQMVGRAIRGPSAGGTDTALVVTVVSKENPAFSDIARAFVNWETNWNPDTEEIVS